MSRQTELHGDYGGIFARLDAAAPLLVRVIAPAGYGKSTFCRSLIAHVGHGVQCDLSGVKTAKDLVRVFVDAMAEVQGTSNGIENVRISAQDHSIDADALGRLLSEYWQSRFEQPSVLVLDHAHALMQRESLAFLNGFLARRISRRMIVMTSRVPLDMRLSRTLLPDEILTVGAKDLLIPDTATRAALASYDVREECVEDVLKLSCGWPAVLKLFVRFARAGKLEDVLGNRVTCAYDDLLEYLRNEVIASLDAQARSVLFACAAIPKASARDVAFALSLVDVDSIIERLAHPTANLLNVSQGICVVHPMVAKALLVGAGTAQPLLREAARGHVRCGHMLRAAELFHVAGDRQELLRALDALSLDERRYEITRIRELLRELHPLEICENQALWVLYIDALAETEDMWSIYRRWQNALRSTHVNDEPQAIKRLYLTVAYAAAKLGLLGVAQTCLTKSEEQSSSAEGDELMWMIGSLVAAQLGDANLAKTYSHDADARERIHKRFPNELFAIDLWSAVFAATWPDCAENLFRRLQDIIRLSPFSVAAARCVRQFGFVAWLFGRDDLLEEIRQIVNDEHHQQMSLAAALPTKPGRALRTEMEQEPSIAVVINGIVSAAGASTSEEALELLEVSGAMLPTFAWPLITLLWLLVRLQWDKSRVRQITSEIDKKAAALASPAIEAIVSRAKEEAASGHLGLHGLFARAFSPIEDTAPLRISVYAHTVHIGERQLELPDLSFALLTLLATRDGEVTREELGEALWHQLPLKSQLNALKSCVHRTRAHFHGREFLQTTKVGYSLQGVVLDIKEAELQGRRISTKSNKSADDFNELRRVVRTLAQRLPECLHASEWFMPMASRARNTLETSALTLGTHAIECGDFDEAADLAQILLLVDSCSEAAHTLIIRSHIAKGDRLSATRALSRYRELLKQELDTEPSSEFVALFEGAYG